MKKIAFFIIAFAIMLSGCADTKKRSKGIYILLGTSGTEALDLKKAQSILNDLLGSLQPHDTLAAACINTASFSEKDIIAKVTFNRRPSITNNQKRAFKKKIDKFISNQKISRYTDISGGISQAIKCLNKTDPGKKYILIFSDLKEKLKKIDERVVPFRLAGFHIVALNVHKLSTDTRHPKKYLIRVEQWRTKVESGYGKWYFVNDLKRLKNIISK